MTLAVEEIERWARQIILPEVGGRGQLRLLRAQAVIVGGGDTARFAALLLGRAGVGTLTVDEVTDAPARPAPDVTLDVSGDLASLLASGRRARDAQRPFVAAIASRDAAVVATMIRTPCVDCTPLAMPGDPPGPPAASGAPFVLAAAALAAAEALRVLLAEPAAGRIQTLHLGTGDLVARDLGTRDGCAACGAAS